MKILLLHQFFVTPNEPGHTRHFELAHFLQKKGHEWSCDMNINLPSGSLFAPFPGNSS